MLNKVVAAKWVAALQSGEYAQTQEALRDTKGYCCIGVLCDLYRKEVGNADWDKKDSEVFIVGYPLDAWAGNDDDAEAMEDNEAPRAVKKWSGLDEVPQGVYIKMNDAGVPFATIAAQIAKDAGLTAPIPHEFGEPL
jgi:hypothetical protein